MIPAGTVALHSARASTGPPGRHNFRTVLAVPMLREGVPVGVLALTRSEAKPFTDKQIDLVSTFDFARGEGKDVQSLLHD
jgi:GAF domain-containing protein